jgi:hypothetical protein
MRQENEINSLNRMIDKPKADEKQVLGLVEKIACAKGEINYTIKTETESFTLTSKDFSELALSAMVRDAENLSVGCDTQMQDILAVVTYRPNTDAKAKSKGNLLSLVFVPKFFKLRSDEELAKADEEAQANAERERKEAMLDAIGAALRQPQEGDKREIGIVEKIECSGQNVFFLVKTESGNLRLKASSPQNVRFAAFTPEVPQMQIGCGAKMPPIPAVVTYRPNREAKAKQNGEIVAVEFVPESFKLQ